MGPRGRGTARGRARRRWQALRHRESGGASRRGRGRAEAVPATLVSALRVRPAPPLWRFYVVRAAAWAVTRRRLAIRKRPRAGVEGISLALRRVADGLVGDGQFALAGHADLDRAAVEAVKTWRFEPAQRGKEAATVWVTLPVRFQLTHNLMSAFRPAAVTRSAARKALDRRRPRVLRHRRRRRATAGAQRLFADGAFARYRQAVEAMDKKNYEAADSPWRRRRYPTPRARALPERAGGGGPGRWDAAGGLQERDRALPGSFAGFEAWGRREDLGRADDAARTWEKALG